MDSGANKVLIVTGLVAAPVYLSLIMVLGELEPGFSHLVNEMSLLGGISGVRGLVFNVGLTFTGILVIVFGFALWHQLPVTISARLALGLFVLGGMGLIGAGLFHCNAGCSNVVEKPELVGRLHVITAFLAGVGTGLAPFSFWAAMRKCEQWKSYATATLIAAILANVPGIIFWVTFLAGYKPDSIAGLIQRLGFVVILIWMFYIAIGRLRQSHKKAGIWNKRL